MEEELSLRDIADILGQYKNLLLGLPLLLGALAFGAGSLRPSSFSSQTVLALNNVTNTAGDAARDDNRPASTVRLDPNLLPSASALAHAYEVVAPRRLASLWSTDARKIKQSFRSNYDDKSNAITLSAQAGRPEDARARAEQVSKDFVRYTNDVVTNVISQAYLARRQQAQLDLQGDKLVLANLRQALGNTPPVLAGQGQSSGRQNAGASGIDPRFTGNSDQPANPAYSYIAVRVAEIEARLADNQAVVARLDSSLRNPEQLLALARQTTQISTLADANLPTSPEGPGLGVVTVLAVLLGGLLAVLTAFVQHALRRPLPPARPRELGVQHKAEF